MLTEDQLEMKRSYTLVDYIAKVVGDCELEQMAQGAQMRRMDEWRRKTDLRLDKIEISLDLIVKHLGIKRD